MLWITIHNMWRYGNRTEVVKITYKESRKYSGKTVKTHVTESYLFSPNGGSYSGWCPI